MRERKVRSKNSVMLHFFSRALSRLSLSIRTLSHEKMDAVLLLKQALAHVVAERSIPPTPLLKDLISKVRCSRWSGRENG